MTFGVEYLPESTATIRAVNDAIRCDERMWCCKIVLFVAYHIRNSKLT